MNLGNVRVPIDVADVVVGQPSKEIDQMLKREEVTLTSSTESTF